MDGGLTITLALELMVIGLLLVWLAFLEESLDLSWFRVVLFSVGFKFCFTSGVCLVIACDIVISAD